MQFAHPKHTLEKSLGKMTFWILHDEENSFINRSFKALVLPSFAVPITDKTFIKYLPLKIILQNKSSPKKDIIPNENINYLYNNAVKGNRL